jgi:hypothetical protein
MLMFLRLDSESTAIGFEARHALFWVYVRVRSYVMDDGDVPHIDEEQLVRILYSSSVSLS